MKNLSENQISIENAVKELRELISQITELTTHVREILSQLTEMTSVAEVINPTIFPIPDCNVEMPRQASVIKEEPN